MTPDQPGIPDGLLELKHRLEEWRATHPARSRLPESLWTTAAELAQRHGLHLTSKTLRLDYPGLKRRLKAPRTAVTGPPAFLELLASTPPTSASAEYVVELESVRGRMRVAIKGATLDWTNLLHAWRSAQP